MNINQETKEWTIGITVFVVLLAFILFGLESSEHKKMRVFCESIYPDADSYVIGRCISNYEDTKEEYKNYCYKDNATAKGYRKCLDENDYQILDTMRGE